MSARKIDLMFGASLIALLSVGFPGDAQACACCSEIGQRLEQSGAMDGYERGELDNVRFAAVARLFTDPGFPDSVEGVKAPSDQDYRLVVLRQGNNMVFEFADAQGGAGRISFPMPKKLTRFEVDPREAAAEPAGNGPALYKEWRLDGVAKLGGTLAARGQWAHASLVLHGRGNSCTSADDFTSWTLSVTGERIRFRFLGTTER